LPGGVRRRLQHVITSHASGGRRDMLRPPLLLVWLGASADAAVVAAGAAV